MTSICAHHISGVQIREDPQIPEYLNFAAEYITFQTAIPLDFFIIHVLADSVCLDKTTIAH
jgi:hypothetical protein